MGNHDTRGSDESQAGQGVQVIRSPIALASLPACCDGSSPYGMNVHRG
jgi:hypothetical protein